MEANMNKLVCGFAASLLLGSSALAQPSPLSNAQLDRVSAGFFELDVTNVGVTAVSLFFTPNLTDPTPNTIHCNSCYLTIISPFFSVAGAFGHPNPLPSGPPE
jgi:hypothetical protein